MTIGLSTAISTCAGCRAVISADSTGTVWDAVHNLERKREALGWTSDEQGRRLCPGCGAKDGHPEMDAAGGEATPRPLSQRERTT